MATFAVVFVGSVAQLIVGCRTAPSSNQTSQSSSVSEPRPTPEPIEPDAGAPAVSWDDAMACRRKHCYVGAAKACLDRCYHYSHPRDPEAHDRCNHSCRQSFGVYACESLCEEHPLAFEDPQERGPCADKLARCRKPCSGGSPGIRCERVCLDEYDLCTGRE